MDEELRRIRADETAADTVYAAHYNTPTTGDDDEWFINGLLALAPKETDTCSSN